VSVKVDSKNEKLNLPTRNDNRKKIVLVDLLLWKVDCLTVSFYLCRCTFMKYKNLFIVIYGDNWLQIWSKHLMSKVTWTISLSEAMSFANSPPSGRGTVVLIVSCRCTHCCLETTHGKITRHYSQYCTVVFCYVHKCELYYMCPGHDKTAPTRSEIIWNRVCGIWLGIGEGANVIISK